MEAINLSVFIGLCGHQYLNTCKLSKIWNPDAHNYTGSGPNHAGYRIGPLPFSELAHVTSTSQHQKFDQGPKSVRIKPNRSLKSQKRTAENAQKRPPPPRRKREEDDTPTERHVVRPGIVPSHSEIASSLRRNGPGSRYPIFKEELENCRIDERMLEMSVLINLDVIILYLQIYGNAGSARSLCWYF